MSQLLTTQPTADALAQGGGDGAGGSDGGGGIEAWSDDDAEEAGRRRQPAGNRARASSLVAPSAPSGAPKRRAGTQLQGARPKKPKGSAAATRREEATAKAVRFHRAMKQPPVVHAAPLSLQRSTSASIIGGPEGSANTRCMDPRAELQSAMERNAREAREEQERADKAKVDAARAAQEEADVAARALADASAKAQAEKAAKAQAEKAIGVQAGAATHGQAPLLIAPLRSMPPATEVLAPTGGAGIDKPAMEREGDMPSSQGRRRPSRRRLSRPKTVDPTRRQCLKVVASCSAPTEWLHGGGTSTLIKAAQDVQADFRAEATALQQCMKVFMKTRATVQRQLGEAQTALRAKEAACLEAEQERDRLAKQLADQADAHKAELQKLKDAEEALQAEFEKYFPSYSVATNQAVETHRDERRLAGMMVAPNAPRTLAEEMVAIEARLQPTHRALRRLQRAGAQVVSALWPSTPLLRIASRTSDWLEVAIGHIEAWKGSSARAEAGVELEAVAPQLRHRAAAIAEYTDTSVFLPELDEAGAGVPPNCHLHEGGWAGGGGSALIAACCMAEVPGLTAAVPRPVPKLLAEVPGPTVAVPGLRATAIVPVPPAEVREPPAAALGSDPTASGGAGTKMDSDSGEGLIDGLRRR
nr:uncharacterized protein LOC120964620 [Aegilops tauschii subsp. strangulata]